jgi:hypothetical protein
MHHRALAASLVILPLAIGLGAGPASAQVGDSPEGLRDKARAALAAGDKAAACLLYGQSYLAAVSAKAAGTAGPDPGEVLFDLADCHEKQGVAALAASEYEQVAQGAGPKAEEAKARAAALRAPAPPPPAATPPPQPPPVQLPVVLPPTLPPAHAEPPKAAEDPGVRVGDFMDTRLSWTFGDDDVLHQTGQAIPLSPDASIGDRKQYRLFFDNLNSRFGGRENLTHLSLYKKMPGYFPRLDTEASLVIRFDIGALSRNTNNLNQAISDSGSFIRLFYRTTGDKDGKSGVSLTLWPLDTDRFRLGYLYDISWGGTNASINQSIFPRIQGSSPGAKLQLDGKNASAFLGFKTATIVQVEQTLTPGTSEVEEIRIGQTNFGVLGGGGVDIGDHVHADVGGGFFQQGKFDLPDVPGKRIYTFGASARVIVHHKDMPVPQSIDFTLYRNDPNKPQIIFKPETYTPGKTTWAVSVEGSLLGQHLKDFDAAGATAIQPAASAALSANIKSGYLRGTLTGIFRDLPFVLRNQPSFIPFQTLPNDAITKNEFFLAAAVDYAIESVRLTPGIGAGLQFPATFNTISTSSASSPINRTVVVREQGNIALLPENQGAVPIFQMRASLKWDVSRILSAIAWIQYVRDNNGTFVERDPNEGTVALRTFISPDFLGLGTSVQARF